jgi:hypothetical protein
MAQFIPRNAFFGVNDFYLRLNGASLVDRKISD